MSSNIFFLHTNGLSCGCYCPTQETSDLDHTLEELPTHFQIPTGKVICKKGLWL